LNKSRWIKTIYVTSVRFDGQKEGATEKKNNGFNIVGRKKYHVYRYGRCRRPPQKGCPLLKGRGGRKRRSYRVRKRAAALKEKLGGGGGKKPTAMVTTHGPIRGEFFRKRRKIKNREAGVL